MNMLKKLFGLMIPVLLHTPLVDPLKFMLSDEPRHCLSAILLRAVEESRLQRQGAPGIYAGKVIGKTKDTLTLQRRHRIPRTFAVTPNLLSDAAPIVRSRPGTGHRFRDVRIGDMVQMDVTLFRGATEGYICFSLGIYRRPGGKIPPAADTDLPERCRMHNIYNAHQFAEENALPSLSRSVALSTGWLMK